MKNVKLVALALSLALAACSDSNTGTVSFALTARQAAAPAASAELSSAGDSTVVMLGNDSIIIRSAQLVLRKVELKHSDVASCDAVAGNGDCEEFETGATLVTLPLGSTNIDRKSTRLNSSHGYISYAVFCLKKKKRTCAPKQTRKRHSSEQTPPTAHPAP